MVGFLFKAVFWILLSGFFSDFFESSRLADGQFAQNLAVQGDSRVLKSFHELGIGGAVFPGGSIDTGNPKALEVALFIAPVTVLILSGSDYGLPAHLQVLLPGFGHTLSSLLDFFDPFSPGGGAGGSHLKFLIVS